MRTWILLPVVALGGMLLGAIPLLIAVEREKVSGQAMEYERRAPASHGRELGWLCLLPLVVYALLWSSVSASLSWSGLLVGGVLLAVVAGMVFYMHPGERGEDAPSDISRKRVNE